MEEWKDIIGYEGKYQISNYGNVKSLSRTWMIGRKLTGERKKSDSFMALKKDKNGYLTIYLLKNKIKKVFKVHRLVGEYFLSNPLNKTQINHIDGCKSNNYYKNLEWVTRSENTKHAIKTGLIKTLENSINSKTVYQYDLEMNLIKEWNCVKNASITLNINKDSISNTCCGRQKTAGGFIWSYKNI